MTFKLIQYDLSLLDQFCETLCANAELDKSNQLVHWDNPKVKYTKRGKRIRLPPYRVRIRMRRRIKYPIYSSKEIDNVISNFCDNKDLFCKIMRRLIDEYGVKLSDHYDINYNRHIYVLLGEVPSKYKIIETFKCHHCENFVHKYESCVFAHCSNCCYTYDVATMQSIRNIIHEDESTVYVDQHGNHATLREIVKKYVKYKVSFDNNPYKFNQMYSFVNNKICGQNNKSSTIESFVRAIEQFPSHKFFDNIKSMHGVTYTKL